MSEKQTEVVKFLNFLSNPNALSSNDLGEINDWVEKYPYSQSLKFIGVKAAQKGSNYSDLLAEAATIAPSRKILHDLIHQPANFFSTVLPFTLDDDLTVEERQIAVASEENLEGVEDKSKLSFGINLNEIYGSEYQIQKPEQESPLEIIKEEIQEEEVSDSDEEIIAETEEKSLIENFEEEKQEEILAFADEEVTEEESSIENIEEETQEEISAFADDEQTKKVFETEEESPVEIIEEEIQEEDIAAIADEEVLEEESEVKNIEEEISTSADKEVLKEEFSVENIEKETQKNEEVLANTDEERVENIEEEELGDEVSANADEDKVEEIQDVQVEPAVEDIEEEVSVITDEEQVENIEQENLEDKISANADEDKVEEIQDAEVEPAVENIEEETLEEEVSANADEDQVEEIQDAEVQTSVENIEEETQVEEVLVSTEEQIENIEDEITEDEKQIQKEEPVFKYAPQTDFFALNRKDKVEEKQAVEPELKADESVSAYNDERMPYTFLWWLNKTRKEHANTQPYSSFKLDTTRQIKSQETDGLNHQIVENIFHLRGIEELSSSATNYTVPFDFRKKEFQIIEKFIKEEPQIRPPAANKIDSENKAKKSSEDKNQVVSETLAKIYVEQMLYHKALDVYKKLSLKFPEKSIYFASQIKYLELKVN